MRKRFLRALRWVSRLLARWSGEEVALSRGLTLDSHPLATEVRLTLDRPRKLRFTMAEASAFKKATGISVWTGEGTPDGLGIDIGALEIDNLVTLLAISCQADDPQVTAEQLAPHLAGEKLMESVAALMVLIGDFLPEVSEDDPTNPLMAGALLHLMNERIGRSPLRPSGFPRSSTGDIPRA